MSASHESNPHPYLRVTWTSVPWVTWEAVTGMEGTLCRVLLNTHLLTGLWSTQNHVECIRLKAAENCSNISSVINDPLGETGPNLLYGLLTSGVP